MTHDMLSDAIDIESLLAQWRAHLVERRIADVEQMVARLSDPFMRETLSAPLSARFALPHEIREATLNICCKDLLPECLCWLAPEDGGISQVDLARLTSILRTLGPLLPLPAVAPVAARQPVKPYAWSRVSLLGALVGFFLWDFPQGFGGGTAVGSIGSVALVAWLWNQPLVQQRIGGGDSLAAESVPAPRGWAAKTLAWFRDLGLNGAVRVLRVLLKPAHDRPRLETAELRQAIEQDFDALAALVCVLSVLQIKARTLAAADGAVAPATADTYDAIRTLLQIVEKGTDDADALKEAVLELQQTMVDDGYRWVEIPAGTPYQIELSEAFHTFGLLEPGQPVTTLKAALMRHQEVIVPGRLARQRGVA